MTNKLKKSADRQKNKKIQLLKKAYEIQILKLKKFMNNKIITKSTKLNNELKIRLNLKLKCNLNNKQIAKKNECSNKKNKYQN